MAIWSSFSRLVSRNRTRLAWVCGTVASGYVLLKYAQTKWDESQTKREGEQVARANIKRHFEQNLHDASFVVASLLPTLGEHLFVSLDVEQITAKLQQTRSQPKQVSFDTQEQSKQQQLSDQPGAHNLKSLGNDSTETVACEKPVEPLEKSKLELWEEIKILSFTRTISSVYLINLLTVFTTLQLSILGRFFYLDSVATIAQQNQSGDVSFGENEGLGTQFKTQSRYISEYTERQYLTFSWYLLNIGWKRCVERVQKIVEDIVGRLSLKTPIGHGELVDLIGQIRFAFEHDDVHKSLFHRMDLYLLPLEGEEKVVLKDGGITIEDGASKVTHVVEPPLKHLLDDTRDFLESPDFQSVLQECLNESFDLLLLQLKPHFTANSLAAGQVRPSRLAFEPNIIGSAATFSSSGLSSGTSSVPSDCIGESASGANEESPELAVSAKIIPLAGVLPIISRTVHHVVNGVPNLFLDVISSNPNLKALSIIVYTSWHNSIAT
ncbi:hypothetical protein BASA50_010565 [Batrachochytrium salamandrivorans]|uniref:Peroxin-3 n=1 Tax=Batrachochytrium salamandrivorans TaxID=1357716 RepID=A0ABQ8EZ98_9FUNG|nr:hypothetical protein BASA60_008724 [Batrachochytrium salamandrivorans]KAH6577107.1 hypothetical protein BASA62_001028 [Batrachochytrium salamandrivorans]KAH6585659.1 hypothetical protein BASA61_006776 [Batrachochytrium salamandrivorans]KAH6588694.1 hypothetical protein BASA50_010565 [Batrachochytrium salamandrivorans]KAH9247671.1 hypothetical protein BASA81_014704 [Batrachochytrium salamandrivorans]